MNFLNLIGREKVNRQQLKLQTLSHGYAWLDTGTHDEATEFVKAMEKRRGLKIACIEEFALNMNFITMNKFNENIAKLGKINYADYLK